MAKILVTGGAGYVGSHVMWALKDAGHHPIAIDDFSRGSGDNIRGLNLYCMDYTKWVSTFFEILRTIKVVVHCAALTSAPDSVKHPHKYYRHNVGGTGLLLNAMRLRGLDKIVFSSSAAVYGGNYAAPYFENDHTRPVNPYGSTKLVGEQMLKDFDMAHIALRYFNVAGADAKGRCGPRLDAGSLFANLMQAALGDGTATLYRHPRQGETPVRDFIHPTDLGHAHVLAVNALLEGAASATYNVGTGTGHHVSEVFAAFQQRFPHMTHDSQPLRPGDSMKSVAEVSLIAKRLGWHPTNLSSLDSMVETLIEWHK